MARRAVRDTYGIEPVGPDSTVRRVVKAGQFVPETITEFEDDGAVVEDEYQRGAGLGASSLEYPHQRGVALKDQVAMVRKGDRKAKVSDEEAAAAGHGGQDAENAGDIKAPEGTAAPGAVK